MFLAHKTTFAFSWHISQSAKPPPKSKPKKVKSSAISPGFPTGYSPPSFPPLLTLDSPSPIPRGVTCMTHPCRQAGQASPTFANATGPFSYGQHGGASLFESSNLGPVFAHRQSARDMLGDYGVNDHSTLFSPYGMQEDMLPSRPASPQAGFGLQQDSFATTSGSQQQIFNSRRSNSPGKNIWGMGVEEVGGRNVLIRRACCSIVHATVRSRRGCAPSGCCQVGMAFMRGVRAAHQAWLAPLSFLQVLNFFCPPVPIFSSPHLIHHSSRTCTLCLRLYESGCQLMHLVVFWCLFVLLPQSRSEPHTTVIRSHVFSARQPKQSTSAF